jgi:hypothetical protein
MRWTKCVNFGEPRVTPVPLVSIIRLLVMRRSYPTLGSADEYPQTVQELVMNGFELRKVVHAYELIGDNFDDLLGLLISNTP